MKDSYHDGCIPERASEFRPARLLARMPALLSLLMKDEYGSMALGMAIGVAMGAAIGVGIDNVPIGIAIGIAAGAGLGYGFRNGC